MPEVVHIDLDEEDDRERVAAQLAAMAEGVRVSIDIDAEALAERLDHVVAECRSKFVAEFEEIIKARRLYAGVPAMDVSGPIEAVGLDWDGSVRPVRELA